jgi:hypothetical protein
VQTLELLPDEGARVRLFEPRLVAITVEGLKFIGFERAEDACWVMQEWDCELL